MASLDWGSEARTLNPTQVPTSAVWQRQARALLWASVSLASRGDLILWEIHLEAVDLGSNPNPATSVCAHVRVCVSVCVYQSSCSRRYHLFYEAPPDLSSVGSERQGPAAVFDPHLLRPPRLCPSCFLCVGGSRAGDSFHFILSWSIDLSILHQIVGLFTSFIILGPQDPFYMSVCTPRPPASLLAKSDAPAPSDSLWRTGVSYLSCLTCIQNPGARSLRPPWRSLASAWPSSLASSRTSS